MSDEARGGSETDDAQERALLERRAVRLARHVRQPEVSEGVEVAVFRYGRERYAIELGCLLQIFALRDLALLPGAKPPVIGLTAWRGGLLRLLDLGGTLGRTQGGIADRKRVLALASGSQAAFGILIDAIEDVRTLPLTEIRALPGRDDEVNALLRGVTPDAVLVLDADALIETYA